MAEPEPELCKLCGKSAQFGVHIALERLYDFPVAKIDFYLCEACVEKPQVFRIVRSAKRILQDW